MANKKRPRDGGRELGYQLLESTSDSRNDSALTVDWISALAAQEASRTAAADGRHDSLRLKKEERIERRRNKKQERLVLHQAKIDRRKNNKVVSEREGSKPQTLIRDGSSNGCSHYHSFEAKRSHGSSGLPTPPGGCEAATSARAGQIHRERVKRLASQLLESASSADPSPAADERTPTTADRPPRKPPASRLAGLSSSSLPSETLLKNPFRKRKWEEALVQPSRSDYGGIGLARPSLFLPLDDPSLLPRLEEAFGEHVPGFFGRPSFHKSAKKQSSHRMLWRALLSEKEKRSSSSSSSRKAGAPAAAATTDTRLSLRVNGKKLSE
jgi:hypothetical protein